MIERVAVRALALLASGLIAACIPIAYSSSPQGQLQSIGLPGLPVWQSQTMKRQQQEAASGELATSPGAFLDPSAGALYSTQSDEAWLTVVNGWRTQAGVQPIGANAGLSRAAEEHSCYLVKNGPSDPVEFQRYARGLDQAAHTEDPDNPYFTQEGTRAAHTGDISFERNPEADVNGLVEVAFHRLSILAPWVSVAGYGGCGRWPARAATLVLRGSTPVGTTKPVLFPPDGSTVNGSMPGHEWPNPLTACPGYRLPVGIPITVQTGAAVRATLKSYTIQDQSTGQKVEACGFDFLTYPNQWGQRLLLDFGTVAVIPREPLSPGHTYAVNVTTQRNAYSWTFHVAGRSTPQTTTGSGS